MSYTINFYDSGKSGKSSSDTLGIRIIYTPVAAQPSALPNSTPQPLKGAISRYRRRWSKDRRKYPRSGGGSGIAAPACAAECAGSGGWPTAWHDCGGGSPSRAIISHSIVREQTLSHYKKVEALGFTMEAKSFYPFAPSEAITFYNVRYDQSARL